MEHQLQRIKWRKKTCFADHCNSLVGRPRMDRLWKRPAQAMPEYGRQRIGSRCRMKNW